MLNAMKWTSGCPCACSFEASLGLRMPVYGARLHQQFGVEDNGRLLNGWHICRAGMSDSTPKEQECLDGGL